MKILHFGTILAAASWLPSAALAAEKKSAPAVSITEHDDRLRIELDGELFTEYIFKGEERFFPVFYPVNGPGQVPMTRKFPLEESEGEDTDHPHHQSLWFAHSDVNEENFWAIKTSRGREPGHTVHQGFTEIESGDGGGHFVSENAYVAPDGKTIMTDTRTVRFYPVDDSLASRILDITIAFHASNGPVTLRDEKDAGMAIRLTPELQVARRKDGKNMIPANGKLINSEGVRDVDTWGKRARWVDAWGTVGDDAVGVALMDHPSNPRHPTWWHSRTYGLVTANAFGKHFFEKLDDPRAGDFEIPEGETETFRWRFVFHREDPKTADVEGEFKAFSED
ncbi:MAG: PmoA family protein [Verrucomicrobiales bacterium]